MLAALGKKMIEASHIFFGFISLFVGIGVLLQPKGTKAHKISGKLYVASMLGLNITAFGIYNIFGGFGVFHWAAIISLLSVLGGLLVAILRARVKNWVLLHYELMVWSYIGLLAATSNEVFAHVAFFNEIAKTYNWLPLTAMLGIIGFGAASLYCWRSRAVARFVKSSNA